MTATDRRTAFPALATAGVLWGTTVPLSKQGLLVLPPAWLTVVRFLAAGAVLAAFVRPAAVRRAARPSVLLWGAVGYGGTITVQNAGLMRTSVTHAALLIGAVPVLVAVIAAVVDRARTGGLAWTGFVVSLAGVGLIAGAAGGTATLAGDVLVLASVALSASFTVAQARLLPGRDPVAVTTVQFLAAGAAALLVALAREPLPVATVLDAPAARLIAVVALATAGTVLPFTLFAFGQARVPAGLAGAFLNLETVVGAAIGAVLFGDDLGLVHVAGGLAVLAGIVLSTAPRREASDDEPPSRPADGPPTGLPTDRPTDIQVP